MTSDTQPITIKKYANRRLYNTGTSTYVTLEDLAVMVKRGADFLVFDARNGDDITRSVLTQIIFEQEGKSGQNLLPVAFLRQLIRFYGDSMQMMVPSFLELSLEKLAAEGGAFREQFAEALGVAPLAQAARPMFGSIEDQVRKNMTVFRQAMSIFPPFTAPIAPEPPAAAAPPTPPPDADELEAVKQQLGDLQRRLDSIAPRS